MIVVLIGVAVYAHPAYADDLSVSLQGAIDDLEGARDAYLAERAFGESHVTHQVAAMETVKSAIELYESTKTHQATVKPPEYFVRHTNPYGSGAVAFAAINSMETDSAVYPFVVDVATMRVVAEGAFPVVVGLPAIFMSNADRPLEDILEELNESDGVWITYTYNDPSTGIYEDKRAWLSLHDGYIFGAGYYLLPDGVVLDDVDAMVLQYDINGEGSFAGITADSDVSFVLDAETLDIVAHTNPERSGSDIKDAIDGNWSLESLYRILNDHNSLWVSYPAAEPRSSGEYVRAYMHLHDGYIFASGYGITSESRIQSLVDEAVYLYDLEGSAAFEVITSMKGTHHMVLDLANTVQALSGRPISVGVNLGDRVFDQDQQVVLQYLKDHAGLWIDTISTDFEPGNDLRRNAWMVLHDGYRFSAAQVYSPEAEVAHTVDAAVELYKALGEEAFDHINWESVAPKIIYPFVVDAETWETIAHGTVPGRVGVCCSHAIAESNDLDYIRTQLEGNPGTWIEYTFYNPVSGKSEYKRVWLAMYDGYIFGSGYYYGNFEQAQSIIDEAISLYDTLGRDAAFESINAMSATGLDYPYVMDHETLNIVAHGQRPNLVGVAFVDKILGWPTATEVIRSNLVNDGDSTFGNYGLEDPQPGTPPLKTVLFQLHDGYIFAAGQPFVVYTR